MTILSEFNPETRVGNIYSAIDGGLILASRVHDDTAFAQFQELAAVIHGAEERAFKRGAAVEKERLQSGILKLLSKG